MKTSLPYYTLAVLTFLGLATDNPNPFPFIAIIYAGFPILDQFFTFDNRNPNDEERLAL